MSRVQQYQLYKGMVQLAPSLRRELSLARYSKFNMADCKGYVEAVYYC
jgi:hypothetical protein